MKIRFKIAFLISPILLDSTSSILCWETCIMCPAIEFKVSPIRFNAFLIADGVAGFILNHKEFNKCLRTVK